ncbi:MAG: signal peptidase I [Flavobacteriales bacterium]|nr:signal peptidase I [Flavobacteriales bacterium]
MKSKINIKPIAIVIIVVGFLILLKFQFPHYGVASVSMSPALSQGDIILVNKFIKGDKIANNDVCVFESNDEEIICRIVALPGDKLEIVDGVLFINDIEQDEINTSFTYKVLLGNHPPLVENDLMLLLHPVNQYEEYTAELTRNQANEIAQLKFVKSISKIIHPKGYHYSFKENPIFPHHYSFNWSRDNFGPIIIPKKGDNLSLINYYFAMGDNRHQSLDSRFSGFIPEENIIGKMVTTLYSPNE